MKIFDGIAIPNSIKLCLIKELASETVYPDTNVSDTICELINKIELASKQNYIKKCEAVKKWYKIDYGTKISYLNLTTRQLSYIEPKEHCEVIDVNITEKKIKENVEKNLNRKRKLLQYFSQKETSSTNKNLIKKLEKIIIERNIVFEKSSKKFFEISNNIRLNHDRSYAKNSIDKIYNEYLLDLNHFNNFTLSVSRFSTNIFLLQSQMIFGNWAEQNIYLLNEPTAINFCEKLIQDNVEKDRILQFTQFGNDYFEFANEFLQKAIKSDDIISHTQSVRVAAHYFWVANLIGLVIEHNNLDNESLEYSYLNAEEGWACCVTALTYKDYIYEHPNWYALVAKESALSNSNNFIRQYSSSTNPIIPRVMAEIYDAYGCFLIANSKNNKEINLNELLSIRKREQNLGISELQIIDFFLTEMFNLVGDNKSSNYFKEITIKRYLTYKMLES